MKRVFADTFYFVALVNRLDAYHERATEFARTYRGTFVTTRWILAEMANAMSKHSLRAGTSTMLRRIENDPNFLIIEQSDLLFERGRTLYLERPDKEWSLTDCVSFLVMEDNGLREALTNDHHFAQAGYVAVFA